MQKFERGELNLPAPKIFIKQWMDDYGATRNVAKEQYNRLRRDEIWINDLYQVNIDRNTKHGFPFPIVHLSIKRRDRQPIHDWRHLQEIKNLLCGDEFEAMEIYPAESRLADSANQYHLWVMAEGVRIPCGFGDRLVIGESLHGAVQRPFEKQENENE